ncbi:MAG: hypothetical protein HY822_13535, partial [Acidobacteria bacterium]|nr:hypothetical protein [Acidobacteriota bacterium]
MFLCMLSRISPVLGLIIAVPVFIASPAGNDEPIQNWAREREANRPSGIDLKAMSFSDQRMTRDPGATCAAPEPAERFLTTDAAAYVWFIAREAKAGDQPRDEWYAPDGRLYRATQWAPMQKDGGFCLWARQAIAGTEVAAKSGKWQVKVYWNDQLLFTLSYTIAEPEAGPRISAGGVVNGADYTAQFAPGCLFSIFGERFAGETAQAASVPLPRRLGAVSVEVLDGDRVLTAPLFFVSPNQINAQLPFGLGSPTVRVRVRNAAGTSNEIALSPQSRNPRLFTQSMDGRGEALLLHADYTLVRSGSPAHPGEVLILYLTGLGNVSPAIEEGQAAGDGSSGRPLNRVEDSVEVLVAGLRAEPLFVGLAPNFAGLYQVNFRVPSEVPSGSIEILVRCGRQSSQESVRLSLAGGVVPPPATSSVGPAGGRATVGSVDVDVPASAFDQTVELRLTTENRQVNGNQVTPIFTLSGLPNHSSGPLTIAVRPAASFDRSRPLVAFVEAVVPGRERVSRPAQPAKFTAEAAGDQFRFTLPAWDFRVEEAAPNAGTARTMAAANPEPQLDIKFSLTGSYTYVDATGKGVFEIWTAMDPITSAIPNSWLLDFQRSLEDIKDYLERAAGIAWPARNWPLRVYLYDFGDQGPNGKDNEAEEGNVRFGKASQCINVNSRTLKPSQPITLERSKIYTAHELFHVLQNLYNPTTGTVYSFGYGEHWNWFFEAASVWLECRHPSATTFPRDVQEQNALFARNGLECQSCDYANHGYGASLFLEFLSSEYGVRIVGDILKTIKNYSRLSTDYYRYVPVSGIVDTLPAPLDAAWRKFVRTYMEGRLFRQKGKDWPSAAVLEKAAPTRINMANLTVNPPLNIRNFEWQQAALSAIPYKVDLPADISPNVMLSLTLSAGADYEALLYGMDPGAGAASIKPLSECTSAKKTCSVSNPGAWRQGNRWLAVVVVNSDTKRPYNSSQPFTLQFSLVPDPLSRLSEINTITGVLQ